MTDNNDHTLNACLSEIKEFEAVFVARLNELGGIVEDSYAQQANLLRRIVDTTVNYARFPGKTGGRILIAGGIISKAVAGYGAVKAAKEHNRRLDRWMAAKREYADRYMDEIARIVPRVNLNAEKMTALARKYFAIEYQLTGMPDPARVSNLMLQVLNLCRTSLYLSATGEYLLAEMGAWIEGKQTSGMRRPDYLEVNRRMEKDIFAVGASKLLHDGLNASSVVTGAQVAVISDPQLSVLGLSDMGQLKHVDLDDARRAVRVMASANEGLRRYRGIADDFRHRSALSLKPLYYMAAATVIILTLLGCFVLHGGTVAHMQFVAIAWVLTGAVTVRARRQIIAAHVEEVNEWLTAANAQISAMTGYVEQESYDYSYRHALKEGFRKLISPN